MPIILAYVVLDAQKHLSCSKVCYHSYKLTRAVTTTLQQCMEWLAQLQWALPHKKSNPFYQKFYFNGILHIPYKLVHQ